MTRKPPTDLTAQFERVIDSAEVLTERDISNVRSLMAAGEWLVALETLCTQIYEWEILLEADAIQELEHLNVLLGGREELTQRLWQDRCEQ